jgi:hypothetical protein
MDMGGPDDQGVSRAAGGGAVAEIGHWRLIARDIPAVTVVARIHPAAISP